MAFSNAGGGSPRPQMNVTPLIDVLLVLIIVFMVVVSMDKSKGFDTQIPQPPKNPNELPPPERTIVTQVEWTIERVAFVRGDDDIDFEDVAKVIDIAKRSGGGSSGAVDEGSGGIDGVGG
jgi:biopolymer transport protein TolR